MARRRTLAPRRRHACNASATSILSCGTAGAGHLDGLGDAVLDRIAMQRERLGGLHMVIAGGVVGAQRMAQRRRLCGVLGEIAEDLLYP